MKKIMLIIGLLSIQYTAAQAAVSFSADTVTYELPMVTLDGNSYTVIASTQNGQELCKSRGLKLSSIGDVDTPYALTILRANITNGVLSLESSSSMISSLRCTK